MAGIHGGVPAAAFRGITLALIGRCVTAKKS